MSALLSCFFYIHSIRYGSICTPRVQYTIFASGIAVVVSDGVNVFLISDIECSSSLPNVL
jgi:hypothetical protein